MISLTDIGALVLILVAFGRGFNKGFFRTLLTIVAIVLAGFITLNYTKDFVPYLKHIPFVTSYPLFAIAVIFVISYIVLQIGAYGISLVFANSTIFNNVFLKILGGLLSVGLLLLVITVFIELLQNNNVNVIANLPNYEHSYTQSVLNYINNGLDIKGSVETLTSAFKQAANNLNLN